MLARRIERDVKERGRSVEGILEQYLRFVKPSYDNFVRPTAAYADIIVPGLNNAVAIDLITTHIQRKLQERSNQFREKMCLPRRVSYHDITPEDLDLAVLPSTSQLKGILTILRSKDTSRQDFIFFCDRLATLLVEFALQYLPYSPISVSTPTGAAASGHKSDAKYLCGVSIQRSGCAFERGFRRVIRDVPMGSLLVQTDAKTSEPLLLQVKLPLYIRKRDTAQQTWAFILDAQIGTGAAAFMAIRILLDHGVPEDHIIFVAFLVAKGGGIATLRRAFPKVRIVCGAVDDEMREGWIEGVESDGAGSVSLGRKAWFVQPGMGQIGDRYYL